MCRLIARHRFNILQAILALEHVRLKLFEGVLVDGIDHVDSCCLLRLELQMTHSSPMQCSFRFVTSLQSGGRRHRWGFPLSPELRELLRHPARLANRELFEAPPLSVFPRIVLT
jgi:hypothetical protein